MNQVIVLLVALCAGCVACTMDTHICTPTGTKPTLCEIGVNNTILVLSCPNKRFDAHWMKVNPLNHTQNTSLCGDERNCTVNRNRELTNQDSGLYFCINSTVNGSNYLFVNVNVLAPPEITNCNPDSCHRDFMFEKGYRYKLKVSYDGNGPFTVHWLFNGSDLICGEGICVDKYSTAFSQTIVISTLKPEEVQGEFRAIVSNLYGRNETSITFHYNCDMVPATIPNNELVTLNLTEGSTLNYTVKLKTSTWTRTYACYTREPSKKFSQLMYSPYWRSYCADCPVEGPCIPFNVSTISIQKDVQHCPPKVLTIIEKESVTLDDSGTMYLAWLDFGKIRQFETVRIRVSPKEFDKRRLAYSIPPALLVLLLIVLTIVLGTCVVKQRRRIVRIRESRNRRRDRHYARHSISATEEDDPRNPLLTSRGNISRGFQGANNNNNHGGANNNGSCTDVPPDVLNYKLGGQKSSPTNV